MQTAGFAYGYKNALFVKEKTSMQARKNIILRITLIFLSVFMLNVSMLKAQEKSNVFDRILKQVKCFPQEKTYIHTDASTYLAGERIWLKVYVVDALSHEPINKSRYAYVELIAADGGLADRIKIQEKNGAYYGYMDIPAHLRQGRYLLRGYTLLSAAVEGYEDVQYLDIINDKTTIKQKPTSSTPLGIPAARPSSLSFMHKDGKLIVSTTLEGEHFLLAHCRAYPFLCKPITNTQPIAIDNDSLPQGVIQLLLLDKYANVLSTKLLLSANDQERLSLPLLPSKLTYKQGEHIRIPFDKSMLHEAERADLSVSVRREEAPLNSDRINILSQLFLASDVNTLLPYAATFYNNPQLADKLLSSFSWTRYNMAEVIKGKYSAPLATAEESVALTGNVRTLLRRLPIAGAKVSLIIPALGFASNTQTDSLGEFAFNGIDIPARTECLVKANKQNGSERLELVMHETDYPALPTKEQVLQAGATFNVNGADNYEQVDEKSFGGILLDNVNVVTKKSYSSSKSDAYSRTSEYSFGAKEINDINATCIHELLRRVPGLFIRKEQCYVRAVTTVYGKQRPAAIVVDGVFAEEGYDLDQINMSDIARIDVYKSGTTVIWGARGGSGVISITTKRGCDTDEPIASTSQKKVMPLGYEVGTDFSRFSQNSRTVWWNPVIIKPYIEFDALPFTGNYHITVEGVTSQGRLVHEECNIKVER